MAFHRYYGTELVRNIGYSVEIATDNNLIAGVLIGVENNALRVVETTGGYTPTQNVLIIPIFSVNYVRILGVA